MTWVRLDDGFREHPKAIAAGDAACWLYACGLMWTNRYLTDGRIPKVTLPRLLIQATAVTAKRLADKLVSVGLWEESGDAYQVHDYGSFNKLRSQVEAERQAHTDRVRGYRSKGRDSTVTASHERSATSCDSVVTPPLSSPLLSSPDLPSEDKDTATAAPPPVVLTPTPIPRPRQRATKPPSPPKPKLPFRAAEALAAIRERAGTLFAFDPDLLTQRDCIVVEGMIRHVGDLADWQLLGDWIAAGATHWTKGSPVGTKWLIGELGSRLKAARDWAASGRPPIGPQTTPPRATRSPQTIPASPASAFKTADEPFGRTT